MWRVGSPLIHAIVMAARICGPRRKEAGRVRIWWIFILSCGLSLFVPAMSAAQVHVGVQGGIAFWTLSNLRNAIDFGGPVEINARTGVVLGSFVSFGINDRVAVQAEVLFVERGASATDGTNELKIKLGYIDIPILARFRPTGNKPFYVLVGSSVNFNVSAKTVDVVPAEAEEDIKDDIKTAEFALVFGAGVSIRRCFVEGRYMAGLRNVSDDPAIALAVRNRGVAILVGARFWFGPPARRRHHPGHRQAPAPLAMLALWIGAVVDTATNAARVHFASAAAVVAPTPVGSGHDQWGKFATK
jgi:Outer membrane protein beta-barrel domain